MTIAWARRAIVVMMGVSAICALVATFVDHNLVLALISISGFFTFRFAWDNPRLLVASNWKEFGERVDQSTNKASLLGSRWYFLTVLVSGMYIIIANSFG